MIIDFEEMFTYLDYQDFKLAIKNKQLYSFNKLDQKNNINIHIEIRECDNGFWEDNLYVGIDGMVKSDRGFGFPYSLKEAEKLSYNDIINLFYKVLFIPKPLQHQTSLFNLNNQKQEIEQE